MAANAIGMTANVVGILDSSVNLTARVISALNAYVRKDYNVQRLTSVVKAAGSVVLNLKDVAHGAPPDAPWLQEIQDIIADDPKSLLSQYVGMLSAIEKDLKGNSWLDDLLWPFKIAELQEIMEVVDSLQNSFQTVLQSIQAQRLQGVVDTIKSDVKVMKHDVQEHGIKLKEMQKEQRKHGEVQSRFVQRLLSKEDEDFCLWLSDQTFSTQVDTVLRPVYEDSQPKWIFTHETFSMWSSKRSDNLRCRVLWANGEPGAGKSVLAATVATHLRKEAGRSSGTRTSVATFFFNTSNHVTVEAMLRCVARQLLEQQHTDQGRFVDDTKAEVAQGIKERVWLEKLLLSLWSRFEKSFLIIDALDECHDSEVHRTVSFLKSLMERNSSLRLMVTSRQHMKKFFSGQNNCFVAEHLLVAAHVEDIRAYAQRRIKEIAARSDRALFYSSPKRREEIVEEVVSRQTDRWVFFLTVRHIDVLADCETEYFLDDAVSHMSSNLDEAIEDVLRRIKDQRGFPPEWRARIGMRALLWISHAKRPLLLEELQQALATYDSMHDLDERHVVVEDIIITATKGLITMDETSGVLTVHNSVLEYLNRREAEAFGVDPEREMAQICLKYLCFSRFDCSDSQGQSEVTLLHRNPFLTYAAMFWGYHVAKGGEAALMGDVLGLFQAEYRLQRMIKLWGALVIFDPRFPTWIQNLQGSFRLKDLADWFRLSDRVSDEANALMGQDKWDQDYHWLLFSSNIVVLRKKPQFSSLLSCSLSRLPEQVDYKSVGSLLALTI